MSVDKKVKELWRDLDSGPAFDAKTELLLKTLIETPEIRNFNEAPAGYENFLLARLHEQLPALPKPTAEKEKAAFFSWLSTPQFSWAMTGVFAFLFILSVTVLPLMNQKTPGKFLATQKQNDPQGQMLARVVSNAKLDSVKKWIRSTSGEDVLDAPVSDEALNKAFEQVAREMGKNL